VAGGEEVFKPAVIFRSLETERGAAADARANSRHNSGLLTLERRINENAKIFVRVIRQAARQLNRINKQPDVFRQSRFRRRFKR